LDLFDQIQAVKRGKYLLVGIKAPVGRGKGKEGKSDAGVKSKKKGRNLPQKDSRSRWSQKLKVARQKTNLHGNEDKGPTRKSFRSFAKSKR